MLTKAATVSTRLPRSDTTLSWTYSVHERVTVKPSVGFYIDRTRSAGKEAGHNARREIEVGKVEDVGADPASHNTNRVGVGTGVFTLGSPREIEFSLKIAF